MRTALGPRRYYRTKVQQQFPKGRVCAEDNCSTVLSIYNSDDWCSSCDDALVLA